MTPTATAISSLLLSLGLATCGWRFFEAFKKGVSNATEGSIGKLLTSLFFLAAAYNGILGAGSLILMSNPASAIWVMLASHVVLTLLALLSVHTVYYIFWPETSPKTLLGTISLMGGVGLFHINTPLQLTTLLIQSGGPSLFIITGSLLGVSLAAILYLFTQLYRRTEARTIKVLSAAVCGLIIASTLNVAIQAIGPYWNLSAHSIGVLEIMLGLVGLGFLLSTIATATVRITTTIFIVLIFSWIAVQFGFNFGNEERLNNINELWSLATQAVAFIAIWIGFRAAKKFGGFSTSTGKAIYFFAIGITLQIVAHNIYYIYVFLLHQETPYPSPVDIGYIGSIIFYLIGTLFVDPTFLKNFSLKKVKYKLIFLFAFFALFAISCSMLRTGYVFNINEPIKTILDFSYPLIESLFLSTVLIIYLNKKAEYSTERKVLPLVFAALLFQYLADTFYTYLLDNGLWPDGTISDLFYLSSYFLMALVLLRLSSRSSIQATANSQGERFEIPNAVRSAIRSNYGIYGSVALFLGFLAWWAILYIKFNGHADFINNATWPDFYNLVALWGVWCGFRTAGKLNFTRTLAGKAIILFTAGLLMQVFGQIAFGYYYNVLGIDIPYPSLADIPYFFSPILYLLGTIQLGRHFRVSFNLSKINGIKMVFGTAIIAILLSIFSLDIGTGYQFDWNQPVKIILDFAYPIVEGMFLVTLVAIWTDTQKRAVHINAIRILGAALFMQFLADAMFTYLVARDLWYGGSWGELLYLSSYFLMAYFLNQITKNPHTDFVKQELNVATSKYADQYSYKIPLIDLSGK